MEPSGKEQSNLEYWMSRALQEWDRACDDFAPETIHDLRVALRRCRSIAEGYMIFDPHPAWRRMRKEGRRLFQQLGALRDTQVMLEWVRRIAPGTDPASMKLVEHLSREEEIHRESASEALHEFNRKKWASWTRMLPGRAHRIPAGSLAFEHLALERWTKARTLHKAALRNRSHASYHRLRIALKRFRYTVENFLPDRYLQWEKDLGDLQDLLGETHDLHVLFQTALEIRAFPDEETRARWKARISGEIQQRLEEYRKRMLGKGSLWFVWRASLPPLDGVETAALARLRTWAAFRDKNPAHTSQVTRLCLQIYDGLVSLGLTGDTPMAEARFLLEAAAMVHDVGTYAGKKGHHRSSYRMIRKMDPAPGLDAETLRSIALIARFHQGPPPHPGKKAFAGIPGERMRALQMLCGIIRLADALVLSNKKQIPKMALTRTAETLRIHVPGYEANESQAEKIAAARYVLETSCGLPILICPV